jgi:tripartite-type tricarboxylate transporter receptor subunit TctC
MGGQVTVMWDNLSSSMPFIKSGRLRAIAVTAAERYPALPEVPTIAESGVPSYEASAWFGIAGPTAIPNDVIMRLTTEVNRAINGLSCVGTGDVCLANCGCTLG